MKVLVGVLLLLVGGYANPLEKERSDVVAKLHEILAELEGTDSIKSDGSELLEEVDISDMNLDDFKESGDEFILDSDKTTDLLEEFRQAMANQDVVSDHEKNDIILLNEGRVSAEADRSSFETDTEDISNFDDKEEMSNDEEEMGDEEEASDNEEETNVNENVEETVSINKPDGSDLLAAIDISDLNLDDFKESGDEFILDSDKTANLLDEFRQAMANQGEVSDDEKNDIILLQGPSASESNKATEKDSSELNGAELLEEVDSSHMNLDTYKESGDEFILGSDKTAGLLNKFRQAMATQKEVSDNEKNDIILLNEEKESSKSDGTELLEEVDISDMNLDDFKESGDEFILDSDKTAHFLEEFRQAMASQGEVSDNEKNDVILMQSSNADEPEMESIDDEEIDELNLDSSERSHVDRMADFEKADAENAQYTYPKSPDSFVSEVLSDLNSEE